MAQGHQRSRRTATSFAFYLPPIEPSRSRPRSRVAASSSPRSPTGPRCRPCRPTCPPRTGRPAGSRSRRAGSRRTTASTRALYTDPIDQLSAKYLTDPNATFRFDASDLMPAAVGAGQEWKAMTAWFAENKSTRRRGPRRSTRPGRPDRPVASAVRALTRTPRTEYRATAVVEAGAAAPQLPSRVRALAPTVEAVRRRSVHRCAGLDFVSDAVPKFGTMLAGARSSSSPSCCHRSVPRRAGHAAGSQSRWPSRSSLGPGRRAAARRSRDARPSARSTLSFHERRQHASSSALKNYTWAFTDPGHARRSCSTRCCGSSSRRSSPPSSG